MKILSVDKIRQADAYTIKHEPIESIDLMERAGNNCFEWIYSRLSDEQKVMIYAGVGNNAGDGLVIARLLAEHEINVELVKLKFTDKCSDDFSTNMKRLKEQGKVRITEVTEEKDVPVPEPDMLVVDAIFGSGLGRPVKGLPGAAITAMNQSEAITVAIDIPSGMYADKPTDENEGAVVHADYTLSLQLPKYAMLMPENEFFVGELNIIPIGLHDGFLSEVKTSNFLITEEPALLLPLRSKFSHKGTYGHALIMAGSYGKMGACVLAAKSCLRTGAGLVTAHIPKKGYDIIQTAVPECMVLLDNDKEIQANLPELSAYSAVAVGPGIGMADQTQKLLKLLIQQSVQPLVLDADALNILAENKTWLSFLPPNSILTPHPGEFDRLAGKSESGFERLDKARDFARRYNILLVLKGAHTAVCTPQGNVWLNSTGNPGMATAGSGDTLTGIIAGLLAQRIPAFDAAVMGVYLHGLAGDIAAKEKGYYALIASDITDSLPDAFHYLNNDFYGKNLPKG